MKFFLDFIRSRIITLVCIIITAVIFAVVLSLYNLPSEPVLYALLLSLAAVTAIGAVIFIKAYRKHNILTRLANEITVSADNLPKAVSADDKDYGRLIRTLSDYCIFLKKIRKQPAGNKRILHYVGTSDKNAYLRNATYTPVKRQRKQPQAVRRAYED